MHGSDRRTLRIPNGELQPQPSPRNTRLYQNGSPQPQPSPQDAGYIGRGLAPSLDLRSTTQPTLSPIRSIPTSQLNSSTLWKINSSNMQLTNLIVVAAAIGASAAPTKELHARTNGIKLCKQAGKWKVGWPAGSKPSEQYTCSNNGLLVSIFTWRRI